MAKQEAQQKAWEQATFHRDMIEHRDILTGQIAAMYSQVPIAVDEIEKLATDVIADKAEVSRVMYHVNLKLKKRLDDMGEDMRKEIMEDFRIEDITPSVSSVAPAAENADEAAPLVTAADTAQHPDRNENDLLLPAAATTAVIILAIIAVALIRRRGRPKQS